MKLKLIPTESDSKFELQFTKNGKTIPLTLTISRWRLQKKRSRDVYQVYITLDSNCSDEDFKALQALNKEKTKSTDGGLVDLEDLLKGL